MRKAHALLLSLLLPLLAQGQSIHFSQFYNAPLLTNASNTGLMPEYDYRVGANYRNQWTALPVPFNTTSAFADCKVGAHRNGESGNWLGIGGAVFNDKAGSGSLSLLQVQGSMAYHLRMSRSSLLSFGGSGAFVQRSVDYNALTFDAQWDGISFDTRMPNRERLGTLRTSFTTVGAGANISIFPNQAVYIKAGLGINNINQPIETFYNGGQNTLKMRQTANIEAIIRTGEDLIMHPVVFYSTQSGATEILAGTLLRYRLGAARGSVSSELLLGGYYRLGDAAIAAMGYQYGAIQVLGSYDFTMSTLSPHNAAYGALEISLVYSSNYVKNRGATAMYACPRFN